MKRRKILLVCYGVPFGGAEVYTGRLARLLENNAEFYALCGDRKLVAYLGACGVKVFAYSPVLTRAMLWKAQHLLMWTLMLPYLRLRYGIDTLWIQGFREALFLPWARVMGYTTVATMHVTLECSVSQLLYPYLILSAHKVICVSKSVAESLPAVVPRGKLTVVRNWVCPPPKTTRRCRSDGEPLHMLYVGRLIEYKGASLIIDAMWKLRKQGKGDRVLLTIVGEGSLRPELEFRAKGLDVRFAGFMPDPARAYQCADAFINPTLGPEGSPLVSLEAMSNGLPCILSDLDVNREITDDGKYALLFRRGDSSDLCAKIEMFLTSRELLESYSQLSLSVIDSRHNSVDARARYIEEIGL